MKAGAAAQPLQLWNEESNMGRNRSRILRITRSAAMLALLVVLQWVTKPLGQLVTGSFVNGVLALSVLLIGLGGGIAVALLSPVAAYLLGIAPNLITVPAIMLGNLCYVVILGLMVGKAYKPVWRIVTAWLTAAFAKFIILYVLVVKVICGVASGSLMGKKLPGMNTPLLAPKMLQLLPAMFTWPQLVTALIGCAAALSVLPLLRKTIK